MRLIDRELLPGVHHVEDCMGVCFTLIVGARRALLVDVGYGFEDVAAFVRGITPLPVTLWLTHAHHDHALGARWFGAARLHPDELPEYATYAAEPWLGRVLADARENGVSVDEAAWRARPMPAPEAVPGETIDLGGLTARVLPCPGHTPGSVAVYLPERALLLTGDDWNPCTWLFFPEALPVAAYRANLRGLLALPFERVICPHRTALYPRRVLEAFAAGLTDEAIAAAPPSEVGAPFGVATRALALPEEQVLVFDGEKARGGERCP